MKKRLLSLLLVGVLTVGMMTGCGDKEKETNESSKVSQEQSKGSEKEVEVEDKVVTVKVWGKEASSAATWATVENSKDWITGKEWAKKLEEMGVELEAELISNEQFTTTVSSRMQANLDLPDIINAGATQDGYADFLGYGASGNFWSVQEFLEKYDEDGSIMAYMEYIAGDNLYTLFDENGTLWWFPTMSIGGFEKDGVNYEPSSAHTGRIRIDWLEKIGEEYKTFYTTEELLNILVKFQEADVNENGIKDEVLGFNIADATGGKEPISAAFDMGINYYYVLKNSDKGVQCKLDHENFAAYIEYCKKLYDAGVWSTEVLDENNTLYNSNKVSVDFNYAHSTSEGPIAGYENTANYGYFILDDDAGKNGYNIPFRSTGRSVSGGWFINKEADEDTCKAIAKLLDFIYSDEGVFFFFRGIQDVTYKLDDYGNKTLIYNSLAPEEHKEYSMLLHVITNNLLPSANISVSNFEGYINTLTNAWKDMRDGKGYPEKLEAAKWMQLSVIDEVTYDTNIYPLAMLTSAEKEEWNKVAPNVETYIDELILDLITGKKSMDDFAKYRKEVGDLGLDKMLEILNDRYERLEAASK